MHASNEQITNIIMNKKKLATIFVALCVVIGLASYKSYQDYKSRATNSLLIQEVEALSDADVSYAGWLRTDADCVYEMTGKAGTNVKLTLGAIGTVKLKLNSEGYVRYVVSGGKTYCEYGGKQKCQDRYCPVPTWSTN